MRLRTDRAGKYDQKYQGADVGSWPGVLYRFPGVKGPEEFEEFQKVIEAAFERNARVILGKIKVPQKLKPAEIDLKVKEFLKKIVVEQG